MKTLTLLVFELSAQIIKKIKRASVFILAYDTLFSQLCSSVKFHLVILYGSRVMAIFTN